MSLCSSRAGLDADQGNRSRREKTGSGLFIDLNQWRLFRMPIICLINTGDCIAMRQISIKQAMLAMAVLAVAALLSLEWSPSSGLSLSIDSAQARVGRPLTPVSVAGVARRTTRRAVVGGAVVGAAAVGTHCARVLVNGSYVCR
jgi:hypothetical protein